MVVEDNSQPVLGSKGSVRGILILALLGGVLAIALSWGWLTGPNSPLRRNGIAAVEAWSTPILQACEEAHLEDPFLLAGLVYAESRGQADAVSSVGALGLCQLMPSTAEEIAMTVEVSGPPYSGHDNLRMGAHYLVRMLRHRKGDVDLALLSYRMGPGRVSREIKKAGGAEEFKQQLQAKSGSPWGYRQQVIQMREQFRSRAVQGQEAWAAWGRPQ